MLEITINLPYNCHIEQLNIIKSDKTREIN